MRYPPPHTCNAPLIGLVALVAVLAAAAPAAAVKVTVDKPVEEPPPGQALVHRSVDLSMATKLGATLIAEYPTYYLLDVAEASVAKCVADLGAVGVTAHPRAELDAFRVNGYEFRRGAAPPVMPDGLHMADYSGGVGLYLVQMAGPNRAEWYEALRAVGEPVAYYPEDAFLIRAKPGSLEPLKGDAAFQSVGVYGPALKIQETLLDFKGVLPVIVVLDGGQNLAGIVGILQSLAGAEVFFESEGPRRTPLVHLTSAEVRALAFQPEVLWLEPVGEIRPSDERQALVIAGRHNFVQPTNPTTYDDWLVSKGFCTSTSAPSGCYNATANVAVFDTGLDSNICTTNVPTCPTGTKIPHPDLQGREIRFYCANRGSINKCKGYNCPSTSYNYSDGAAHGTAVASIIAGDPLKPGYGVEAMTPGLGRDLDGYYLGSGIAPLARITTFRILNDFAQRFQLDWTGTYTPADFEAWYGQLPGDPQTRFANNSWNDNMTGDYTSLSSKFDALVRDSDGSFNDLTHPMTIVFSAGNNGYLNVVLPPANAKNVVSVGATQSYRTSDSPPWNDSGCGTAASIKNVATFSNRECQPEINRFKPDLAVPASRVGAAFTRSMTTNYSACILAPNANDPNKDPNGRYYTRFWGTSAAAPVVTGMAVLVDEWYFRRQGVRPKPAMVKAMLVAHTDDLYGGTDERTGQPLWHNPSLPQGFGRPNLDKLFQTSVGTLFYDEDYTTFPYRRFRPTQGPWSVNVHVADPSKEVILAMVFTDRFAAENASPLSVNKLQLYVHDGTGHYLGNAFFGNPYYSVRVTALPPPDTHNTVELIRIRPGEIVNNDFTIEVVPQQIAGHAVPSLDQGIPNQDFALYVYNAHQ